MHAAGAEQKGKSDLCEEHQNHQRDEPFSVSAEAKHEFAVSQNQEKIDSSCMGRLLMRAAIACHRTDAESVNGVEHATPARARRKMRQRIENTNNTLRKGGIGIIVGAGIHGPINQKWPAHDGSASHKAPIATIGAIVAIVTHGEIL